jgi:hypothetical protein
MTPREARNDIEALEKKETIMSDSSAFKNVNADHHGEHHDNNPPESTSDESEISAPESAHDEEAHVHHKGNEIE